MMMADPSHREPDRDRDHNNHSFLAYDPSSSSSSSHHPSSRMHRSYTDGRIAQPNLTVHTNPPNEPPDRPIPRSTSTSSRTGGASYFDTYQPYKLNPALTPSLRSSKSKPDLSTSARKGSSSTRREPSTKTTDKDLSSIKTPLRPRKTDDPATVRAAKQAIADTKVDPHAFAQASSKLDAHTLAQAGLDQDGTSAEKSASVDSWRRLAAAAAQKAPGGYTSSNATAGVSRRKSKNDLHAAAAAASASETLPPPPAMPLSSPALWRQRAQALSQAATSSQYNHKHSTCSHEQPSAAHDDASKSSNATTSTARPPIPRLAEPVAAEPIATSVSMPGLAASRQALQSHISKDVPSIEDIIRRGSPTVYAPPAKETRSPSPLSHEVSATFAASPKGMGRKSRSSRKLVQQPVKSIDDIIREHASRQTTPSPTPPTRPAFTKGHSAPIVDRLAISSPGPSTKHPIYVEDIASDSEQSDTSVDSVSREVRKVIRVDGRATSDDKMSRRAEASASASAGTGKPRRLHHATSFPTKPKAVMDPAPPLPAIVRNVGLPPLPAHPLSKQSPILSNHLRDRTASISSTASVPVSLSQVKTVDDGPTATFVRSHKLTQILRLDLADDKILRVSYADVGAPSGHPVFVYLGLGAVRYLIGLYDELASLFNLRLICIDRWGLGKTDDVPAENRGVLEWSAVVAKVADTLMIPRFSILAHSAGAPYAMATALLHRNRISGPIHLLAPWVSSELESSYKWLRYVPEQVIRTAQAAEWRLAGWRLGRGTDSPALGGSEAHNGTFDAPPTEPRVSTSAISERKSSLRSSESTHVMDTDSAKAPSTTMRVALPSPVTGLSSPPSSSVRTPSKTKTSFLGSWFGSGKATQVATDDGGDSTLPSASPLATGSDTWTSGALTPSMRTDEDTWVTSRGLATPETSFGESRFSSKGAEQSAIGSGAAVDGKPQSADSEAEYLLDTAPEPVCDWDINAAYQGSHGAPGSQRSGSLGSRTRTRFPSTLGPAPTGPAELPDSRRSPSLFGRRDSSASQDFVSKDTSRPRRISSASVTPTTTSDPLAPLASAAAAASSSSSTTPAVPDLATSLLRASHAESQRGSTNDLMTILGGSRGSKPWGFTYADVTHPTRVWHGDKDERIGLSGALWMEREMQECTLKVVKGANHSLMTNTTVVIEALESISSSVSGQQTWTNNDHK